MQRLRTLLWRKRLCCWSDLEILARELLCRKGECGVSRRPRVLHCRASHRRVPLRGEGRCSRRGRRACEEVPKPVRGGPEAGALEQSRGSRPRLPASCRGRFLEERQCAARPVGPRGVPLRSRGPRDRASSGGPPSGLGSPLGRGFSSRAAPPQLECRPKVMSLVIPTRALKLRGRARVPGREVGSGDGAVLPDRKTHPRAGPELEEDPRPRPGDTARWPALPTHQAREADPWAQGRDSLFSAWEDANRSPNRSPSLASRTPTTPCGPKAGPQQTGKAGERDLEQPTAHGSRHPQDHREENNPFRRFQSFWDLAAGGRPCGTYRKTNNL